MDPAAVAEIETGSTVVIVGSAGSREQHDAVMSLYTRRDFGEIVIST